MMFTTETQRHRESGVLSRMVRATRGGQGKGDMGIRGIKGSTPGITAISPYLPYPPISLDKALAGGTDTTR